MIIQCAQCSSKFRLDDAKITEAGIKVRCSKCRHIFVVRKEAPVEDHDVDQILEGLGSPARAAASPTAVGGASAVAAAALANAVAEPEADQDVFASFSAVEAKLPGEERGISATDDFAASPSLGAGDSGGETDLTREPVVGSLEQGIPAGADSDESVWPGASDEYPPGGFDLADKEEAPLFEQEIIFGDVSAEAFAAATDVSSSAVRSGTGGEADITFEFDDEGIEEGEGLVPAQKEAEPFDFGEIDFGIEDAGPAGTAGGVTALPDVSSLGEKIDLPPVEPPRVEPEEGVVPSVAPVREDEELPPLSISSRRKGQSFLPGMVIGISVLAIVALAGGGFYFFKEGPAAFDKLGIGFVAGWFGVEDREEGSIGLDGVKGAYLVNAEAGEFFVIRGEVVNNYRKSRASIQVKGTLLGQNGQVLVQKVAYCGNNLTDEQVRTLPVAKIDAAMNNQFGDSLANLGVQPGRRIPFVVVLTNVPREAVDFAVEVVGSTVASQ